MSSSMPCLRRRSSVLPPAVLALAAWLVAGAGEAQQTKEQAKAQPQTKAQQPTTFTEELDVDLVNVDVVVTDKSGNLITDLSREDFQIIDDGKKVEIGYFARLGATPASADSAADPSGDTTGGRSGGVVADPRHLVIFVDLDNLMPMSRTRVLGDIVSRWSGSAEDGDGLRVMVATFGPKGLDVALPFSESPAEWATALEKVKGMPGRGALRHAQQRRLVESIEQVLALAESRQSLQNARDRLDELMGSVRVESESVRADSLTTIHALQTLATVLSTVPGPKALLYVGDGVPIRPGQDLQDLLADVFESDRRFAEAGGMTPTGGNPGSQQPGSEPTAGVPEGGAGAGAADPSASITAMSGSTGTLRLDGMSVDLTADLRALAATANSQRVTIYGLSTDTPGGTARADFNVGGRTSAGVIKTYDTTRSQLFEQSLHFISSETGGLALPPSSSVDGFLDRVLEDQENRYSLAYTSPHGGDSKFHQIKVKVNRKGARLRHREGYIDRPREVRVGDLVAGALLLGSGENPHRMEMELLSQEPAENDEVKVSLGLRIPIEQLHLVGAGANHETKLDLYVLSKDDAGSFAPMRYVEVMVAIPSERMADAAGQFYGATLPLSLKKGPHAVAVGIVEPAAQRTSVARMSVDVGGDG